MALNSKKMVLSEVLECDSLPGLLQRTLDRNSKDFHVSEFKDDGI